MIKEKEFRDLKELNEFFGKKERCGIISINTTTGVYKYVVFYRESIFS